MISYVSHKSESTLQATEALRTVAYFCRNSTSKVVVGIISSEKKKSNMQRPLQFADALWTVVRATHSHADTEKHRSINGYCQQPRWHTPQHCPSLTSCSSTPIAGDSINIQPSTSSQRAAVVGSRDPSLGRRTVLHTAAFFSFSNRNYSDTAPGVTVVPFKHLHNPFCLHRN